MKHAPLILQTCVEIHTLENAGDVILRSIMAHLFENDVLLEVETDKAVTEIESYADGILAEILFEEGAMVKTGEVLAVIRND